MPTKKNAEPDLEDDLQPEYDLRTLLKGGVQGKYAERYRASTIPKHMDAERSAFSGPRNIPIPIA